MRGRCAGNGTDVEHAICRRERGWCCDVAVNSKVQSSNKAPYSNATVEHRISEASTLV